MTVATLQLQKSDSNGVTYANPVKPAQTMRFKSTRGTKSLRGSNTMNFISEIIGNDEVTVTVGGIAVKDAISVRVRTSGAQESMSYVSQLLKDMALQLDNWADEHVLKGFNPVTAPVVTDTP